jgi:pyruvate/2-oxoglutarate dehydrogenase complex dihydrolipoamide dehydrogenase (E3) component
LLYTAEVVHLIKSSVVFAVRAGEPAFDLAEIIARKDRLIQEFADYRQQQLEHGKFEFIRARAWFTGPHDLHLSNGTDLRAKNFIISTGSVVSPSPLESLNEVGFITSDEALFLKKLPKSMIILGGGSVAVEFAQFFSRLGVRVTLIQRSAHILKEEDSEAAQVIETVFRREGVTVFTGTNLLKAWTEGHLKGVSFEYEGQIVRVAAEEIFYGLGRTPNLEGLGLEKAGVQISFGRFLVNSEMQTNISHIYGAGDCTGMYEIVHIAVQEGEIAAHNIIHPDKRRHMDYRLLTSVVFTEPQLARVGLTEKEAQTEKTPYIAASYPFADHGKSLLMEAKDGFVKLLANPNTGEILGGCCVGPSGGELIHEIIVAMHNRMTVTDLAAVPHYHPTLAEIWTYPAEELAEKVILNRA